MTLGQHIISDLRRNLGIERPQNKTMHAYDMQDEGLLEWLGISKKRKGVMSEITYFTCLKMLSEALAKMPIKYYQKTLKGAIEIDAKRGTMAYLLRTRPNPFMTPTALWNAVEMQRNHYGNAYIWRQMRYTPKKFGGSYDPVALWLMPSDNTQIIIDDAGIFEGKGRIWYWYTDRYSGKNYIFNSDDVLHFKTSHCIDGLCGMPVQQILREQVEGNLEAQNFQNNLYKTGMTAKAVLEYTGDLNQANRDKLRAAFEEFGNGSKNTGRIMPVPLGFKLTPLDIKMTDAQFFELRKYSALQIGAAFGIKPNQLNDYEKSSYANSETQQIAFLVDTMAFIVKSYEEEINYKCISPDEEDAKYFYKFNERAILRTDSKTQTEILSIEVDKGIRTNNEARRKIDLPDAEGGDDLIVNGAYMPLTLIRKKAEAELEQQAAANNQQSTQQGREPPAPDAPEEPDTGTEKRKGGADDEKKTLEL